MSGPHGSGRSSSLAWLGLGVLALVGAWGSGAGCGGDEDEPAGMSARIEADLLEGTAPLDVDFHLLIEGVDPGDDLLCEWDFGDGVTFAGCNVRHTYATAVGSPFRVQAGVLDRTTGLRAAAAPVQITVHARPDLRVSGLVVTPAQLQAGDSVTVGFVVENQGGVAVPASEACVGLLREEVGAIPVSLGLAPVAAIEPGQSAGVPSRVLTVPRGLGGGSYRLQVEADCANTLVESDETNNTALSELLQIQSLTEGPDLQVRSLLATPTTVILGLARPATVELAFSLNNAGTDGTGAFRWAAYLSDDDQLDAASDLRLASAALPGLVAGGEQVIRETIELPDDLLEQRYALFVVVDTEDEVTGELDEFNNTVRLVPDLTVLSGAVPGMELLLGGVRLQNFEVPIGGSLDVAFTLCNRGTIAVPTNFFVSVVLAATPEYDEASAVRVGNVNFVGLGAERCVDARLVKLLPPALSVGPLYAGVVVDPSNAVREVDETNNVEFHPTAVRIGELVQVDLTVEGVGFAPAEIAAGDLLRVTYTLRNNSSQRSAAFVSAISISADPVVDARDRRLETVVTPFLNGAGTLAVEELVSVPLDVDRNVAAWTVGVVVDPDDEVPNEPDEGNNVAAAAGTLVITGAQGGCQEDDAEPNDRFADALPIGVGRHPGLGRCGNDDWFGVLVPAGESLDVRLIPDPAGGDLDLELYAADGATRLAASAGGGAEERVQALLVAQTAMYYLRVLAGPAVQTNYTLDVGLTAPPAGINLRLDRVAVSPESVLLGQELELSFDVLDFGLEPAPASVVRVVLSADEQPDVQDVPLGQVEIPALGAASRTPFSVRLTPPAELPAGRWYLLLAADADAAVAETDEQDNAALAGPITHVLPVNCPDDGLEPNNFCAGATALQPGVLDGLVVCDRFDDWYALALQAGDCATLAIEFEQALGDLDLEVYRPGCDEQQDVSRGGQGREQVQFCATESGSYRARVLLFGGGAAANGYRLDYQRLSCTPDSLEPNDTPEQARRIGPAGQANLTTCPDDQDFFLVTLLGGRAATILPAVTEPSAPLALTLYRLVEGGAPVWVAGNQAGGGLLYTPPADAGGDFLLKVRQASSLITHYSLQVGGQEGLELRAGELTLSPVAALPGGLVRVEGTLINARPQPLPAFSWAVVLSVDPQYDPAEDLVLGGGEAVDGLGSLATLTVDERLELPADLQPGQWWVLLVGDSGEAVAELDETNNLLASPLLVAWPCHADAFEVNDVAGQAAALALGTTAELSICRGDVDWWRVPLPAAATAVTVELTTLAARGDLDLWVYDGGAEQTLLGRSASAADVERVVVTPPPASGLLLVRVQGLGTDENAYTLTVGVPQP